MLEADIIASHALYASLMAPGTSRLAIIAYEEKTELV